MPHPGVLPKARELCTQIIHLPHSGGGRCRRGRRFDCGSEQSGQFRLERCFLDDRDSCIGHLLLAVRLLGRAGGRAVIAGTLHGGTQGSQPGRELRLLVVVIVVDLIVNFAALTGDDRRAH